jgi:uncharacterized membrane protein YgcG
MDAVEKAFPVGFYTPNPFIRTGLFLLTVMITLFVAGLSASMFFSGNEMSLGVMLAFWGMVCYGALEFIIKNNHHYQSGVDDALLWMSAAFIIGGINTITPVSPTGNAMLIFILALYLSLRFADMLMSTVATLALLIALFLLYTKLGSFAKATAPFLLMMVCVFLYFPAKKMMKIAACSHYGNCLIAIAITALTGFYAAGNYFVVREAGRALLNLRLPEAESIPFAWLFWILTILVPITYVARGVQKKDRVLLRTGFLLSAASILTIRYYYHFMAAETAMTIAGTALIIVAWTLIKYLHRPKYDFTCRVQPDKYFMDRLNAEALVIGTAAGSPQQPVSSSTEFGGGSGGGGGATGNF